MANNPEIEGEGAQESITEGPVEVEVYYYTTVPNVIEYGLSDGKNIIIIGDYMI